MRENGTGDCNDDQRPRQTVEDLYAVGRAIDEGIDIRGYFHWSLTDNFEWSYGTKQCFGLYAVNYDTLARTKRKSADVYKSIIAAGGVDAAMYKQAYEWGYDGQVGAPMDDTLREIQAEVDNGIGVTSRYEP